MYTSLRVLLTEIEMRELQRMAALQYRHPREQAHYLLRQALLEGHESLTQKANSDTTRQGQSVAAAQPF